MPDLTYPSASSSEAVPIITIIGPESFASAPTTTAKNDPTKAARVSEPATIRLTLNGRLVIRTVRAGAFSFRASYVRSVRVVAQDAAGNVSRTLKFP